MYGLSFTSSVRKRSKEILIYSVLIKGENSWTQEKENKVNMGVNKGSLSQSIVGD